MDANLLDLSQPRPTSGEGLADLAAHLTPLIGESYQFVRVSYGDELTIHFGDLRPARSPRRKGKMAGSYILGTRISHWIIKSKSSALIATDGLDSARDGAFQLGQSLSKDALEAGTFIAPGSRVVRANPFLVQSPGGVGLQVVMTDGSSLITLPAAPEPDEPDEPDLPTLADWDLTTPAGLLSAGPEFRWTFRPTKATRGPT